MPGTARISRFELYPAENPTGYCVGFTINNQYVDTVITRDPAQTDPVYYIDAARDLLKDRLKEMIQAAASPVGSEITIE